MKQLKKHKRQIQKLFDVIRTFGAAWLAGVLMHRWLVAEPLDGYAVALALVVFGASVVEDFMRGGDLYGSA